MMAMTEHQLRNHLQTAMSDPSPLVIPMPREVVEALAKLLNEQAQKLQVYEITFRGVQEELDECKAVLDA